MNRIYQGRVTKAEILKEGAKGKKPEDWEPLECWNKVLWEHHELFQDAVNYYIVALASLGGSSPGVLTTAQLASTWESADKSGQRREGMGKSLQRTWQLEKPPTLQQARKWFTGPLKEDGVSLTAAENAVGYLMSKLGGDGAIQQGGTTFLPMFCAPNAKPTFPLSTEALNRKEDEEWLRQELHRELSDEEIITLARSITLGSVVNLQPHGRKDQGTALFKRLRNAAAKFKDRISPEQFEEWLRNLDPSFSLPRNRKGIVPRVSACILFLAFPNATTKSFFQSTFQAPSSNEATPKRKKDKSQKDDPIRFLVKGEDPFKYARRSRGIIFPGFSALQICGGNGRDLTWKDFDIAAFREALKIFNQFQQNSEKREEKLDGLALRLLVMDGKNAISNYDEPENAPLRNRLEKIWDKEDGKPKLPKNDDGETVEAIQFAGDARIERLRRIINDDLAEEYNLTDARRTAYGLRRRTIKGWEKVKHAWRKLVPRGTPFSEEIKARLKAELDHLRSGEKREQIGSHRLFEALLADEAAWRIWREPDAELEEQIKNNSWAQDPLDVFREYSEIRDAMEETAARPLNFTPADARHSRRLFGFTEACSFGNKTGLCKHYFDRLAITVPVAVRQANGAFSPRTCRLIYSAPRLLRDGIRAEDGQYAKEWLQPMMRALLGGKEVSTKQEELDKAAVQLMPDFDRAGRLRILLNFQLELDPTALQDHLGKAKLWASQFIYGTKEAPLRFLCWPAEFKGKEPDGWWKRVSNFRVLGADLGTRHAASVALLECGTAGGGTARFIGNAGGNDWFARYRSGTILRLAGENAKVLRPEGPLEKEGSGKAFREEFHGERGRPFDTAEWEEARAMLAVLGQSGLLGGEEDTDPALLRQRLSFPELNDKLLVAVRRAQRWVASCVSWHWKLSKPDDERQRQDALAELREQRIEPLWQPLADGNEENLAKLRTLLHAYIVKFRPQIAQALLTLTARILPLKKGRWEWISHPDKEDCHLLRRSTDTGELVQRKRYGQRGLSMARIEQISELRRRWQSLNQSLRRQIGEKPPTKVEKRNDPIPDPCPDLLAKLEALREQRVNQTAHLILAQALGLMLGAPQTSGESRTSTDRHGEYRIARDPVDFIVVEDLSRYRSDQGRAKRENTRLMQWCHRAVTQKLKMLAEPFGIPLLATPAAYSSRFCSLTGMPGFRAAEVGWQDRHAFRWRVLLKEASEAIDQGKPLSEKAARAWTLFQDLEKISQSESPHRTLLAPQPGGPIFITAKAVAHPSPSPARRQSGRKDVLPIQADLGAATNLALRAVAQSHCAAIHHRLRTKPSKKESAQKSIVAAEKRRFGNTPVAIVLRDGDLVPKERNPNLFYDEHGVAPFGRARLQNAESEDYPYALGSALWKVVNDPKTQWQRCAELNVLRLKSWKIEPSTFISGEEDQTDDFIPM